MTSQPYPIQDWPEYRSEGWLLDEDRALRDLMKKMVVTDHEDRARRVEAWFGHPDIELREQKYPYVTIDLLQIQEAKERVHRGDYFVRDVPEWWGLPGLVGEQVMYLLEMPTPVDLDYQIATWARNPRHDRQILQQMITGGRTMLRAGLLYTADGTRRRLDLLSHTKRDMVESGKRLFNNVFRVRISSEVPWGSLQSAYGGVSLTKSVEIKMRGAIPHQGPILSTDVIASGRVTAVDESKRQVDLTLDGQPFSDVPLSRSVLVLPEVGMDVAVLHRDQNRLVVIEVLNVPTVLRTGED